MHSDAIRAIRTSAAAIGCMHIVLGEAREGIHKDAIGTLRFGNGDDGENVSVSVRD